MRLRDRLPVPAGMRRARVRLAPRALDALAPRLAPTLARGVRRRRVPERPPRVPRRGVRGVRERRKAERRGIAGRRRVDRRGQRSRVRDVVVLARDARERERRERQRKRPNPHDAHETRAPARLTRRTRTDVNPSFPPPVEWRSQRHQAFRRSF